ncbi:MAG: glucoamylase family protein, partial [Anaerolineales bacterium]
LQAAQHRFAADAQQRRPIPPAAEWLLDNFYIIQNHLRQVEQDLTGRYYSELPKLAEGPYAGYPRVYRLALELIAHTDSHFDAEVLTRFVHAYQSVAPLSMGELWAVPIMLRLGLVENLRRIVHQAVLAQQTRADADRWADRLLGMAQQTPTQLVIVLAELAQNVARLSPTFVVHFIERVRDQAPSMGAVVGFLEQGLAEQGATAEAVIRAENQRRAANRISVGNVITSLRTLGTIDWNTFFENTSSVEQALRQDPVNVYAAMDFSTRDRYRHVVERLSRRTRLPETEVAERAIALAQHAHALPLQRAEPDLRRAHVGYFLIDRGRRELEAELRYLPGPSERISNWVHRHPTPVYLSAIGLATLALIWGVLAYAREAGLSMPGAILLTGLLAVPASTLAVGAVNWIITIILSPQVLPKLDFRYSLPAEHRTMVVIPCLISSQAGVERLCESLEIRFLANRDPHLHFALLGDFSDSLEEHRPEDEALLNTATRLIHELNDRYAPPGNEGRFYFFHRRRCWNPGERVWMGWERKRGKLIEFNRLLRGATDTTYTTQTGDLSILPQVRYVITLDADTELPINSARRLVGTLAHPLNRPQVNSATRTVSDGYGIIQPRTAVTATAAGESRFTHLFAHDVGLDPYTRAISVVYQDLFGAGSYIGKAIYDVDAALAVLADRFPDNLLLSHDLLEGAHIRTGVASDIQLLEDFPSGYDAFAQRQHRWIRGDWQITDWLFPWSPTMPTYAGPRARNPLPLVERWKIFDNLRQSLAPPALVLLLILGWTILPGSPLVWTVAALMFVLLPVLVGLLLDSGVHPPGEPWPAFFREVRRDTATKGARALLQLTFLLFEAVVNLDAIVRVFVRRAFTWRDLLEWTSAAKAKRNQARTLAEYWGRMWVAPVMALAILLALIWLAPGSLGAALPLIGLWCLSPFVAHFISQPDEKAEAPLPQSARRELRLIARRIWGFYEAFAGPDDHWLPPDNYQQEPDGVIAHRTSPTNIGFLILSTLAAYDFGYLGLRELAERLERVLGTMDSLERYHGHLLNWYDTLTLQPLQPAYVSTVDSGNLAACLMILKQACAEVTSAPLVSPAARLGLQDTAAALDASVKRLLARTPARGSSFAVIAAEVRRMASLLETPPEGAGWPALLQQLAPLAQSVHERVQPLNEADSDGMRFWSERLGAAVLAYQQELDELLLWKSLGPVPDSGETTLAEATQQLGDLLANLEGAPSLQSLAYFSDETLAAIRVALEGATPNSPEPSPLWAWLDETMQALSRSSAEATRLLARFQSLAQRAEALMQAMDFGFLFDGFRRLFRLGYNVTDQRYDAGYYDLLASEARLASLIAIAKGDVPATHWIQLQRPLARVRGELVLLSWGGTMFEFLMPALFTHSPPRTLLHQAARSALHQQMAFGARRGTPWGISESGHAGLDPQGNYRYRAFGAPGLGLRRDLGERVVIAPYASALALPFAPRTALRNLERITELGGLGRHGLYEALDYGSPPRRIVGGGSPTVVRSYMVHHQGMSLIAMDNALNQHAMARRVHTDLRIASVEPLLLERTAYQPSIQIPRATGGRVALTSPAPP